MRTAAASRALDASAVLIVIGFGLIHLVEAGRISFTWDESTDLNTISCLISEKDPFACLNEPQQSRLPFYLHALVGMIRPGEYPHYLLSAMFAILNLVFLYMFARTEFGHGIATLTAALYATSLPMLASGRMLLTHSNVIFTTFTVLTLILGYWFVKRQSTSLLVGSAIAWGLAVASSLLGMFCLFVLIPFYALTRNRERAVRPAHILFFPVAALTFFASTIIYVRPDVFVAAVRGTLHGHRYPFWNIFELGPQSPWWFSLLVLVVKTGPWWIFLLTISAFIYF